MFRVLLAVLIGTASAAAVAAQLPEVGTVVASGASALVAQDTRFDPRLQLQTHLRLGTTVRFAGGITISAGLGVARATATSAEPGYTYPGWISRQGWFAFGWETRSVCGPGVQLTLINELAGIDSTNLVQFFPSVELSPHLRLTGPRGSHARIEVPLTWQFRTDRAVVFDSGFSLPGTPAFGISVSVIAPQPSGIGLTGKADSGEL